jgi:hypothetical protein
MKRIILILLLCIASSVASVQIIVPESTIQAIGYGNSEDEALKSAYQNAVEQYVGVLVDSSTIIRNDRLIKNDILTFSNGYINSYKKLSSKEQMGLWEVKIDAVIKKQNVLEKIKALHIDPIDIKDSEQSYARVISQVKSKFDAEDMLVRLVRETTGKESFERYINLRIDSVDLDLDMATRKSVPVTINYSILFNWDEYHKITNQFKQLFENMGAELIYTKEIDSLDENPHSTIDRFFEFSESLRYRNSRATETLGLNPNDKIITIVVKQNNKLYANTWKFPRSYSVIYPFQEYYRPWNSYMKDKERIQVFSQQTSSNFITSHYSLSIFDANKQLIWKDNAINIKRNMVNTDVVNLFEPFLLGAPVVAIGPWFFESTDSVIYKSSKKIEMDIDKIKDLKQVKISWDK